MFFFFFFLSLALFIFFTFSGLQLKSCCCTFSLGVFFSRSVFFFLFLSLSLPSAYNWLNWPNDYQKGMYFKHFLWFNGLILADTITKSKGFFFFFNLIIVCYFIDVQVWAVTQATALTLSVAIYWELWSFCDTCKSHVFYICNFLF